MSRLKHLAATAAILGGFGLCSASTQAAPTIGFIGGGTFGAGDTVQVDVVVDNLPPNEIVAAYDLDVKYDGLALSFFDVFFDIKLGGTTAEVLQVADGSTAGLVDFAAVSLLSDDDLYGLQGGSAVRLATLQFTALTAGDTSSLAFSNWGPFNDVKGRNNQIIIGQAPEPASLALVAGALLGMIGASRRRQVPGRRLTLHTA